MGRTVQLPGGGVRSCYIEFHYQLKGNSKRIKKDNWGRIQAFLMQGAEDKNSHLALGKNFLYILDYITVGAEMSGKAVPTKIFV